MRHRCFVCFTLSCRRPRQWLAIWSFTRCQVVHDTKAITPTHLSVTCPTWPLSISPPSPSRCHHRPRSPDVLPALAVHAPSMSRRHRRLCATAAVLSVLPPSPSQLSLVPDAAPAMPAAHTHTMTTPQPDVTPGALAVLDSIVHHCPHHHTMRSPTTPRSTCKSPAIPPASLSPYMARSLTEPATMHNPTQAQYHFFFPTTHPNSQHLWFYCC